MQPHLVLQTPDETGGEDLRCVGPARIPLHPGEFGAGRGLHQLAGALSAQARPDQLDRGQDSPQIFGDRGTLPPLRLS
ncbi:hypothetical protein [Streptomyces sp. V4I2]|uniref:hypothetical protein n=1 Tax=Streptomyces sp. V4I2 TaxID=3042280 RepID=UPI0027D865DF|nr:hypothetical protein [Streptomyces sp. V4I2]